MQEGSVGFGAKTSVYRMLRGFRGFVVCVSWLLGAPLCLYLDTYVNPTTVVNRTWPSERRKRKRRSNRTSKPKRAGSSSNFPYASICILLYKMSRSTVTERGERERERSRRKYSTTISITSIYVSLAFHHVVVSRRHASEFLCNPFANLQ